MSYDDAAIRLLQEKGVEESTMMKMPCLRYKSSFLAMMFEKEEALIVKLPPIRVNQLIEEGKGREFNLTGKKFKEWVLIPVENEDEYESLLYESLNYLSD